MVSASPLREPGDAPSPGVQGCKNEARVDKNQELLVSAASPLREAGDSPPRVQRTKNEVRVDEKLLVSASPLSNLEILLHPRSAGCFNIPAWGERISSRSRSSSLRSPSGEQGFPPGERLFPPSYTNLLIPFTESFLEVIPRGTALLYQAGVGGGTAP